MPGCLCVDSQEMSPLASEGARGAKRSVRPRGHLRARPPRAQTLTGLFVRALSLPFPSTHGLSGLLKPPPPKINQVSTIAFRGCFELEKQPCSCDGPAELLKHKGGYQNLHLYLLLNMDFLSKPINQHERKNPPKTCINLSKIY